MSDTNDFKIIGGVLREYSGTGGEVQIPAGVTAIGYGAFRWRKVTRVVIPQGVTVIGEDAFSWCDQLESVVFPPSLTQISSSAFNGCKELTEAILPEGVSNLGADVFRWCAKLHTVHLPSSLKEISDNLFFDCKALKNCRLPDGVTKIGQYAFHGCAELESVQIPETLNEIGTGAFWGCKQLKNICVPEHIGIIGNAAFAGCDSMADENGMVILRGVLHNYNDAASSVVIPSDVTAIGHSAFREGTHLKEITIPDTVTAIGGYAFFSNKKLKKVTLPANLQTIETYAFAMCTALEQINIPSSVTQMKAHAFEGCTALSQLELPGTLTTIEECAFKKTGLQELVIPQGVTEIMGGTFNGCNKLTRIVLPDSITTFSLGSYNTGEPFAGCEALSEFVCSGTLKLPNKIFGYKGLPNGLKKNAFALAMHMADPAVLDYIMSGKTFEKMNAKQQAALMLSKQGKSLIKAYSGKKIIWSNVAEQIISSIHDKYTAKECNAVATLMVGLCDKFAEAELRAMYDALEPLKNAAKAKKTISDSSALMKKLNLQMKSDQKLTGLTKVVADILMAAGKTQKEMEAEFKNFYGIAVKDLPALKDKEGGKVDAIVFAWLMVAHEKMGVSYYYNTNPDVTVAWEIPGVCPQAAQILEHLDLTVFMDALRTLAKKYLGMTGRSKKMFLAYPICRYADETLMAELTKTAPSWRSTVSGNEAPPLWTFRKANAYSNTRAAMLFADKYKELDQYAKLRGTDADTLRDQNLSDVGIDAQGGKTFDLGNQTVTVRLQRDLSFLVELPNGKTAKSLPKKGADAALYSAANSEFSEMKKNVKKILKNRNQVLYQDFLTGKTRAAEDWKNAYLGNALLRRAAQLLVWEQGGKTFTVSDKGLICVDGSEYRLSQKKVGLAHPMDMEKEVLGEWQRYFTGHGLKQPFEQVWEPVVDPANITEDRYKGCMIPFYRLNGQGKHGIWVTDENFHSEIYISFEDCDVEVERIDWARHEINPEDRFEVTSFAYPRYTRKVNHIAGYLDKVTVFGRIAKDDITIADRLESFTLAQITECIRIAQENNAVNVTALLLEYKNSHFSNFDPMDEFVLEL